MHVVVVTSTVRGVRTITSDIRWVADRNFELPIGALEAGPRCALRLDLLLELVGDEQEVKRVLKGALVESKIVVGVSIYYHNDFTSFQRKEFF